MKQAVCFVVSQYYFRDIGVMDEGGFLQIMGRNSVSWSYMQKLDLCFYLRNPRVEFDIRVIGVK